MDFKKLNSESYKRLGKRIAMFRELKGMTQEELAKKMGYKDKSSIAKMECGASPVPFKKLQLFAEVLGVEIEKLYDALENEPAAEEIKAEPTNARSNIIAMIASMDEMQLKKAEKLIRVLLED